LLLLRNALEKSDRVRHLNRACARIGVVFLRIFVGFWHYLHVRNVGTLDAVTNFPFAHGFTIDIWCLSECCIVRICIHLCCIFHVAVGFWHYLHEGGVLCDVYS